MAWAGDVADGLAHIHSKGYIHRDVAARNMLVTSDFRCKVFDFGLAREGSTNPGSAAYYRTRSLGQLPLRWTAIEAVENRKFNEKTDVYSYGILLHEIWTQGALPFAEWTNEQVWVQVAAGYRLPKPSGCPDYCYPSMQQCWNAQQEHRPSFTALTVQFRKWYEVCTGESAEGYETIVPSAPLPPPEATLTELSRKPRSPSVLTRILRTESTVATDKPQQQRAIEYNSVICGQGSMSSLHMSSLARWLCTRRPAQRRKPPIALQPCPTTLWCCMPTSSCNSTLCLQLQHCLSLPLAPTKS